jgi:hypothetical protein
MSKRLEELVKQGKNVLDIGHEYTHTVYKLGYKAEWLESPTNKWPKAVEICVIGLRKTGGLDIGQYGFEEVLSDFYAAELMSRIATNFRQISDEEYEDVRLFVSEVRDNEEMGGS